jgi:hypothetical protein
LLFWRENVALLSGLKATGEVGSGLLQPDVTVGEGEAKGTDKKAIRNGSIIMQGVCSALKAKKWPVIDQSSMDEKGNLRNQNVWAGKGRR